MAMRVASYRAAGDYAVSASVRAAADDTDRGLFAVRSFQCDPRWRARVRAREPTRGSEGLWRPCGGVARKRSEETS
eukprot:7783961-Pyramimonas_sp.AAC.1